MTRNQFVHILFGSSMFCFPLRQADSKARLGRGPTWMSYGIVIVFHVHTYIRNPPGRDVTQRLSLGSITQHALSTTLSFPHRLLLLFLCHPSGTHTWGDLFSDSLFFCFIFLFFAPITDCHDYPPALKYLITGPATSATFFFFPCLFQPLYISI